MLQRFTIWHVSLIVIKLFRGWELVNNAARLSLYDAQHVLLLLMSFVCRKLLLHQFSNSKREGDPERLTQSWQPYVKQRGLGWTPVSLKSEEKPAVTPTKSSAEMGFPIVNADLKLFVQSFLNYKDVIIRKWRNNKPEKNGKEASKKHAAKKLLWKSQNSWLKKEQLQYQEQQSTKFLLYMKQW